MSAKPKTVQVLVRMPPDLRDALKAHGEANDRTMAQTVRYAVRLYLARDDTTEPSANAEIGTSTVWRNMHGPHSQCARSGCVCQACRPGTTGDRPL